MATKAGIDYSMVNIPSAKTRARLLEDLIVCECGPEWWQLSYQKCRLCRRGWPELSELLKYAVRHYVCRDCQTYYRGPEG